MFGAVALLAALMCRGGPSESSATTSPLGVAPLLEGVARIPAFAFDLFGVLCLLFVGLSGSEAFGLAVLPFGALLSTSSLRGHEARASSGGRIPFSDCG